MNDLFNELNIYLKICSLQILNFEKNKFPWNNNNYKKKYFN